MRFPLRYATWGSVRLNCVPYEVLHGLVLENNRFSAVMHRTPDFMRAPAILNYLTPYSVRQLDFILPEVPRYTDSLSLMKSSTSIRDTIDGDTALMMALQCARDIKLVNLLLDKGADVDWG